MMDHKVLIEKYPFLYHMADANSWNGILKYGLLSTSKLLDLFEISGTKREQIEANVRVNSILLTHPIHGTAVIRDNKVMPRWQLELKQLANGQPCLLNNLTPEQWCQMLNERVFLWLSWGRLQRLLNARSYKKKEHLIMTFSSEKIINDYKDDIELSPINTGCTLPYPHFSRGRETFLSISDYPYEDWRRKRKNSSTEPVVELTIKGSVKDVKKYLVRVDLMQGDQIINELFP
ncbi:hypothetical protein LJC31_00730 [Synergistaceae bacterium OttesenSCG-928-I11]|nr:hypothetical protein [Synergistaceae bacterium OttesenSCG-928-I11]